MKKESQNKKETLNNKDLVCSENNQLISILESVLFATDKPLTVSHLKAFLEEACEKYELQRELTTQAIKKALQSLKEDYQSTRRGVVLEELGGGFQIRTKAQNKIFLQKTVKLRPFRLSGPALEVLAFVAYNQPCTKAKVDDIRGVECGHLLRALMERGLVCFGGKSELPGKPMLYKTTPKFLEIFSLKSLKDLPSVSEIEELLPEDVGSDEEEVTLADVNESQTEEFLKTYSAEEKELEEVTEAIRSIHTTTEFFEEEKREKKANRLLKNLEKGESLSLRDLKWLEDYQKELIGGFEDQSQETSTKEDIKQESQK